MVLDTNVLVAAGFRPASASGRLVEAARNGRLVALWTPATRAEAERVLDQIPPLSGLGVSAVFHPEGCVRARLLLAPFVHLSGPVDQTLAALAAATDAPLVTADGALTDGVAAAGVRVLRAPEARQAFAL